MHLIVHCTGTLSYNFWEYTQQHCWEKIWVMAINKEIGKTYFFWLIAFISEI